MRATNTHDVEKTISTIETHVSPTVTTLSPAKAEVNFFPHDGKVRARQIANHLSIGISTWWLYVNQGRVKKPMKFGARVSVWDAQYIRHLAENGIPEKEAEQ